MPSGDHYRPSCASVGTEFLATVLSASGRRQHKRLLNQAAMIGCSQSTYVQGIFSPLASFDSLMLTIALKILRLLARAWSAGVSRPERTSVAE